MTALLDAPRARLDALRERMDRLAARDVEKANFGAAKHQYAQRPPLSEAALAAFEEEHGVVLPADYRLYLAEMSDGGAGPYYGLYSLAEAFEAAREFATESSDESPLAEPFPMGAAALETFLAHRRACIDEGDDDEIRYPELPEPCPGVLMLCEYGCGWSYALVVKGGNVGTVWMIGENLSPVLVDDRPASFFDWLDDWLKGALGEAPKAKEPADVTILNYDGHKLTELPADVTKSPNLKKLVLSRTSLPTFPREIVALRSLRTLDLSMTPITEIPAEIGELRELRKLRFNYAHWTTLPDALAALDKLEELSIFYGYDVVELPSVVGRLPRLKRLRASNCAKLERLPESIGDLSSLELLDVSNTALQTLPSSLGRLQRLKQLKLASTKLTALPSSVGELSSLEWLDLDIDTLDLEQAIPILAALPSLRWLKIPLMERYPDSMRALSRLRSLTIGQNYTLLRAGKQRLPVPDEVGLLSGLEELDLTNNNQASALPDTIGALTNLRRLELRATGIADFPESARKLDKLEVISGLLVRPPIIAMAFSPEVKAKLEAWFPEAKVQIY